MEQEQETTLQWGLVAGAVTTTLYLLSVTGGFFSIFIAYTPLFPLLAVGLSQGVRAVAIAALVTTLLAGMFTGFSGMMVFGLLYGTPSIMFTHICLTRLDDNSWYPVGGALTGLSLYVATMLGFFMVLVMGSEVNLAESLPAVDADASPLMQQARDLLEKAPFLVFALGAWMQLLMFYGIAVFSNYMLTGWNKEQRESLRLTPFMPSALVLGAMLVAGLFSFSGSVPLQMAGKTAFLILLLPYFLVGIARMHARAESWQQPNLWLSVIYSVTVLVFWPIFWFIGVGLLEQAKFLSNRYS